MFDKIIMNIVAHAKATIKSISVLNDRTLYRYLNPSFVWIASGFDINPIKGAMLAIPAVCINAENI